MVTIQPTVLSKKLKKLRDEKNMTTSDINRLTGIAIGTIGDIERGKIKNPGIFTIEKIARALGVSILYFLDDDPGMPAGQYLFQEQFIKLLKDNRFTEYFIVTQKAYEAGIDPKTLNALVEAITHKESGDRATRNKAHKLIQR